MDIVINFDYLEHTYTPFEDLGRCLDLLKPGGFMHLRTLYLDCPAHKNNGEAWNLFGNGHFYFFTVDVLKAMVEKSGFEIIHTRTDELISVYARKPGGDSSNAVQFIERDRSRLHKLLRRTAGRALSIIRSGTHIAKVAGISTCEALHPYIPSRARIVKPI
jgi:hypothetical protein